MRASFFLLDDDEATEQLVPRLFGEPSFDDLGPQGFVGPGEVGRPLGNASLQLFMGLEECLLGLFECGDVVEDGHGRDDAPAGSRIGEEPTNTVPQPPSFRGNRTSSLLTISPLERERASGHSWGK